MASFFVNRLPTFCSFAEVNPLPFDRPIGGPFETNRGRTTSRCDAIHPRELFL